MHLVGKRRTALIAPTASLAAIQIRDVPERDTSHAQEHYVFFTEKYVANECHGFDVRRTDGTDYSCSSAA